MQDFGSAVRFMQAPPGLMHQKKHCAAAVQSAHAACSGVASGSAFRATVSARVQPAWEFLALAAVWPLQCLV